MSNKELFEEYWSDWANQEELNYELITNKTGDITKKYKKKGYLHLDPKFWFPDRKNELKKVLENGLRTYNKKHRRYEWHAFSPFIKSLISTPRYRYNESIDDYGLETKIRPISYASHFDSLIYSFYSFVLNKKYEDYIADHDFSECPIAYRSNLDGQCNIQFAKEVFDYIKKEGECTAIALDVKGYFDNIDHGILKQKWTKILGTPLPEDQFKIFKSLTEYSYVSLKSILKKYKPRSRKLDTPPRSFLDLIPGSKDHEKFRKLRNDDLIVTNSTKNADRPIGIPQGSAMSALLSNIFLIDFDFDLKNESRKANFLYRRYCDDIIVVCNSSEADRIKNELVDKIYTEYNLTIQSKKVEVIDFKKNSKNRIRAFSRDKIIKEKVRKVGRQNEKFYYKPLQYLGFEFDGQKIFLRSSSLSRYFRKMKARVVKTVSMAYSDKFSLPKINKKQIFLKYSHLGKNNFLSYAYNSSKGSYVNSKGETKEGMNSPAIKKQLSNHFDIILKTLKSKNKQRFEWKNAKGKNVKKKDV